MLEMCKIQLEKGCPPSNEGMSAKLFLDTQTHGPERLAAPVPNRDWQGCSRPLGNYAAPGRLRGAPNHLATLDTLAPFEKFPRKTRVLKVSKLSKPWPPWTPWQGYDG